ncbi:hypothetical protein ACOME3_000231 [Neoechinorhynchus agilis]
MYQILRFLLFLLAISIFGVIVPGKQEIPGKTPPDQIINESTIVASSAKQTEPVEAFKQQSTDQLKQDNKGTSFFFPQEYARASKGSRCMERKVYELMGGWLAVWPVILLCLSAVFLVIMVFGLSGHALIGRARPEATPIRIKS